jgi:hypothetical protein
LLLVVNWVPKRTTEDDEALTPVQRRLLVPLAAGLLVAVLFVAELFLAAEYLVPCKPVMTRHPRR